MECKVLKKSVTYPRGGELRGHLEGLFGTYCVSSAQIHPPGGLWAHPLRVGYAFLQYIALQGCHWSSPVWDTLTQNGQKVLKKGVPPVLTSFSVRSRAARPCCRRFSNKCGELPPAGPSAGENQHLFPRFGDVCPGSSQNHVFRGAMSPPIVVC